MENPLENKDTSLLVPALLGAAAAGAITYLLLSENTADLRSKLAGTIEKGIHGLKDHLPDLGEFEPLKDQILQSILTPKEAIDQVEIKETAAV